MTSFSARRNASVGNRPLSGIPPANEITPSRVAVGAAARARSPSLSTMRALRESSADQFSGCAGGSLTTAVPSGGPATNVPCPTCARAQPAATSSSYASATVARLTPSECANSRVAGSFTPGARERNRLVAIERYLHAASLPSHCRRTRGRVKRQLAGLRGGQFEAENWAPNRSICRAAPLEPRLLYNPDA